MSQLELAYRIVAIIFPVFSIVAMGYLYARFRSVTDMSSGNRINMEIFIPALIFDTLSASDYALSDYLLLTFGGGVIVLGSGLVAWPVARLLGYQWKTFVPPMMFNNSGNMGLPLIVLTFGSTALPAAVLLFAIENLLHFLLGQQMISQRWSLKNVFQNPMILAALLGIGVSMSGTALPEFLRLPIHMLGLVSIPLLLFSLGVRMISIDPGDWRIGSVAAIVCPLSGLAIGIPLAYLLPLPVDQTPILLLFAALPPAVLNFLVAERFNQEPQKVASIVLIANFASILVIPVVLWIIL
jgi:predicted permease